MLKKAEACSVMNNYLLKDDALYELRKLALFTGVDIHEDSKCFIWNVA